jgi:glyoxylase-like metal-dependent hydrolase (beta-lactamase superfamily II)
MASPPLLPPVFDTSFDPQTGKAVAVAEGILRITAPNAGPYTFTGTNSFIVGRDRVVVVDPGPESTAHLEALKSAIAGRPVEAILLTHTHKDHSLLAAGLKAATGAPIWFGGQHRPSRPKRWVLERDPIANDVDRDLVPDRVLTDGEQLGVGGLILEVLATPGHCANHLCFGVVGTDFLLSGDHVMGWNSTIVPVPDGSMADYLQSLEKVIASPYESYHPAHGGPIASGRALAQALLAHREMRNEQIRVAVKAGVRSLKEIRRRLYPMLEWALLGAAWMTLRAHAEYLEQQGEIKIKMGLFGLELHPA